MSICKSPLENIGYKFVPAPPASFVRLVWVVCEIACKWLFFRVLLPGFVPNSISVLFPSRFLSKRFGKDQVVQLYNTIDTASAWKNIRYLISDRISVWSITCQ